MTGRFLHQLNSDRNSTYRFSSYVLIRCFCVALHGIVYAELEQYPRRVRAISMRSTLAVLFRAPQFQNTGSVARDHLANERTFLAWIRTGLGFTALGVAVERFSRLELDGSQDRTKSKGSDNTSKLSFDSPEHRLVGMLLSTGCGTIVYGITRYFSTLRMLEKGSFRPAYYGAAGLGVMVSVLAGGAYWSTLEKELNQGEEAREC